MLGVDPQRAQQHRVRGHRTAGQLVRALDQLRETLAAVDILFTMVGTGDHLEQVLFGADGAATGGNGAVPRIVVDCSSIGVDQGQAIRARLAELGAAMIAAPVSGNAKCVRAGKLSAVCSGPEATFHEARPLIDRTL